MSEYAGYIASMQEKTKIVATENICNDRGALLVKSGTELNNKTCENILKFKLLKPIEDSIAIENQFDAKSIYHFIFTFVQQDPWLKAINDKLGNKTALQCCCLKLEKFPILLQKLTVLHMELAHVFEQAVFSAYMAYICGVTSNQAQNKIEEYFLAGIIHDIGFLHIHHDTLKKRGNLTPEEWRTIQSHPIIGYKIVHHLNQFPKSVSRAVLEHHENLDGSGYPRNKTQEDLDDVGQLINLLDNVIAIYNKTLKQQGRSLRGVIPVIQINMHSYSYRPVAMIIQTLKHVPDSSPDDQQLEHIPILIRNVQSEQRYIQQASAIIESGNQLIGYEHGSKEIAAIQNTGNNIILIINSSGLNDPNYTDSLHDLTEADLQATYNEIEDARVMLSEVIYQIGTYQKNADLFVSKNPSHPLSSAIKEQINTVKALPKPSLEKTASS